MSLVGTRNFFLTGSTLDLNAVRGSIGLSDPIGCSFFLKFGLMSTILPFFLLRISLRVALRNVEQKNIVCNLSRSMVVRGVTSRSKMQYEIDAIFAEFIWYVK